MIASVQCFPAPKPFLCSMDSIQQSPSRTNYYNGGYCVLRVCAKHAEPYMCFVLLNIRKALEGSCCGHTHFTDEEESRNGWRMAGAVLLGSGACCPNCPVSRLCPLAGCSSLCCHGDPCKPDLFSGSPHSH